MNEPRQGNDEIEHVGYVTAVKFGALARDGSAGLRLDMTVGATSSFHILCGQELLDFVKDSGLADIQQMVGSACLMRGKGLYLSALNHPVRILSVKELVKRLFKAERTTDA